MYVPLPLCPPVPYSVHVPWFVVPTGFVANREVIKVTEAIQQEGEKVVRLQVYEYVTKRLDEVLSFVEHVHGHNIIVNSTRKKPVSHVKEMSPPPPPVPIADLQQIVGDSIRETLTPLLEPLTTLTPFLESLQIWKVSPNWQGVQGDD